MAAKTKARNRSTPWFKPLRRLWDRYNCWEIGILLTGLLSFIGIIVILFLPIGKGPELMIPNGPVPAAGSPGFPRYLSASMTLPLDSGPRPQILEDGDAIIPALLRDIDGAQKSVSFMAYIWKDGHLSDTLLDHLLKRQRAGVQVRILLDGYGSLEAPHSKFRELEKAGGKVATFHSLLPAPWTLMRTTKRNHRRAIVIDNTVGYTGGLGVDDVWLGHAQPPQWHDVMFRVSGSMASRLAGSFAELWLANTGEALTDLPEPARQASDVSYIALSAAPSPDLYPFDTFLLLSLSAARHSIKIETPYFLPNAT
ncbi:MAG: hypothetical protein JOY77_07075, partial [Alphaproteobacteria bacterium]|nr:hypothetical protein [Alphaproteobacteria bacterium]